jgi:nitroreductase
MQLLEQLNWRYATKKFNRDQKVSEDSLSQILEAIRMSPSSFGLQPYHVLVVTNDTVREQLRAASWNQTQITDASHLLVFCARTDFDTRISEYKTAAGAIGYTEDQLTGWAAMVNGLLSQIGPDKAFGWAMRQAYIALGFGLMTAAYLGIDSCPMEGFDNDQYAKILDLPEHIKPCALLTLGYRDQSDKIPTKTRQTHAELYTEIA